MTLNRRHARPRIAKTKEMRRVRKKTHKWDRFLCSSLITREGPIRGDAEKRKRKLEGDRTLIIFFLLAINTHRDGVRIAKKGGASEAGEGGGLLSTRLRASISCISAGECGCREERRKTGGPEGPPTELQLYVGRGEGGGRSREGRAGRNQGYRRTSCYGEYPTS